MEETPKNTVFYKEFREEILLNPFWLRVLRPRYLWLCSFFKDVFLKRGFYDESPTNFQHWKQISNILDTCFIIKSLANFLIKWLQNMSFCHPVINIFTFFRRRVVKLFNLNCYLKRVTRDTLPCVPTVLATPVSLNQQERFSEKRFIYQINIHHLFFP